MKARLGLLVALTIAVGAAWTSVAGATSFTQTTHPVAGAFDLAAANLGTGNLDIVSTGAGGATRLPGTGGGVFGAGVGLPAGGDDVAVGDFNGDGLLDLAMLDSVLLNDGGAAFVAHPFPPPPGAGAVAAGDVNGDGFADVVISQFSFGNGSVTVRLGHAGGAADPAWNIGLPQTYAAGASPFNVAVGDLNGDGRADVVVCNGGNSSITVYYGQAGPAALAGRVDYPTVAGGFPTPDAIALGDVNGDFRLDVVVAGRSPGRISTFVNDGFGGLNAAVGSLTKPNSDPRALALADFDGDGRLDVATAYQWNMATDSPDNTLGILYGIGTGTFGAEEIFVVGRQPTGVVARDFNGDGRMDAATANVGHSTVTVLLQGSPPEFGLSGSPGTLSVTAGGPEQTSSITVHPLNGFSGTVNFSIGGSPPFPPLPPGLNASVSPASSTTGTTLTVSAGVSTFAGTYPVTVVATSGGLTRTLTVPVTVAPGGTFTLFDTRDNAVVTAGSTLTIDQVGWVGNNGFDGSVTLYVGPPVGPPAPPPLPPGVVVSFQPPTLDDPNPDFTCATNCSNVVLTVPAGTPSGTYQLQIGGQSGGQTATNPTIGINVDIVAPSFTLFEQATTGTITQGQTLTLNQIGFQPNGGFSGNVSPFVSGALPPGVSVTFDPASIAANQLSDMEFTAAPNAAPGVYNIQIGGQSGSLFATNPTVGFQLTVVAANRPPTVQANGPYSVPEGGSVQLNATGGDPDGDSLTYAWDLDNDGDYETSGQSVTFSAAGRDGPSQQDVRVRVTDSKGAFATDGAGVTIQNVAPTVTLNGPGNVNESLTGVTYTYTATDPAGSNDPLTITQSCGSGAFLVPESVTASSFQCTFPDGPASPTASVTANDGDGGSGTATRDVTVANVAPSVTLSGPANVAESGAERTYTYSASDPAGPNDPLTITPSCGSGGFLVSGSVTPTTFACTFPDGPASPTVSVSANDGDGGSDTATRNVTVTNVAPTITSLTGPADPIAAGGLATLTVTFTDPGDPETFTVSWNWGDGTTSTGEGNHAYAEAGVYTVTVTVDDGDGGSDTEVFQYVVVYSGEGFVTGGGWINSPAGAYTPNPSLSGRANFGFVSKYIQGRTTPDGETEFQFKVGNLNFHSTSYDWLVVSGYKAQYKGTGTINGTGSYTFTITIQDGQRPGGDGRDKFRIRILNGAGNVVYDNRLGGADDLDTEPQVIGGGSIVIHRG